jgi:hypothetical protein
MGLKLSAAEVISCLMPVPFLLVYLHSDVLSLSCVGDFGLIPDRVYSDIFDFIYCSFYVLC